MYTLVVVIHVIACIILVLSVLLQQGKGAEVGAVFGSSEAVFGSSGPATLLSKITTAVAVVFMITSLSLTYLAAHHEGGSVMRGVAPVAAPPVSVPDSGQVAPSAGDAGKTPSSEAGEVPAPGHLSVTVTPPAQGGGDMSAEAEGSSAGGQGNVVPAEGGKGPVAGGSDK